MSLEVAERLEERAHKLSHAAERLDMSPRSLERHIALGRVRVIRVGRSVRIAESEIQRILRGEAAAV
jgi:excisionase family DNA binding protein